MQKTKELIELFRAIGTHDLARATTLSRKLAAQHGSRGHYRVERDLLGALNGPPNGTSNGRHTLVNTTWSLGSTLMPLAAAKELAQLELSRAVRITFKEITQEWRARAKLAKHGLPRRW